MAYFNEMDFSPIFNHGSRIFQYLINDHPPPKSDLITHLEPEHLSGMDQFSIFHPAPLIIDPQKGLKKISVAELFTELILDKEKQCLYCEHGPPLSPEYL